MTINFRTIIISGSSSLSFFPLYNPHQWINICVNISLRSSTRSQQIFSTYLRIVNTANHLITWIKSASDKHVPQLISPSVSNYSILGICLKDAPQQNTKVKVKAALQGYYVLKHIPKIINQTAWTPSYRVNCILMIVGLGIRILWSTLYWLRRQENINTKEK